MEILKRLGLVLANFGLQVMIFTCVMSYIGLQLVGEPDRFKGWLSESNLYDNIVDTIIKPEDAVADAEGANAANKPEVQAAIKNTFTAVEIQKITETIIDSTNEWIEGRAETPNFAIDLAPLKQTFATNVGNSLRQKVAALPPCPRGTFPTSTDIFDINCVPPGLNIDTEAKKLEQEILTSQDFLPNNQLTAQDIKVDTDSGKKPYFQAAESLPDQYNTFKYAPVASALLAVVCGAAIVFLSGTVQKGLRRLATSLSVFGAVYLLGGLASRSVVRAAGEQLTKMYGQAGINEAAKALLASAADYIGGVIAWYGVILLVVATGAWVGWYLLHRRGGTTHNYTPPEAPAADTKTQAIPPAPAPQPPAEQKTPNS